jgi:hypothetical protein
VKNTLSAATLAAVGEGDTLVVETKGFSPKSDMMDSSSGLHLVERFTRVAPDVLQYDVTMSDASTWTAPWTVRINFRDRRAATRIRLS